jgi:hypothetical protein
VQDQIERNDRMKHRWMGLGTARMSDGQAEGWSGLSGVADDPLEMHLPRVVCVVCDAAYGETAEECLGPQPGAHASHLWHVLLTIAMTDEEAETWADPDAGDLGLGRPRSVNVVCVLCGQPFEGADETCEERAFWS